MTDAHVPTGAPWAQLWRYARAVRTGDIVEISGTVAVEADGTIAHPGDVGGQTRRALEIIVSALEELGGSITDVTRTRVFLRDVQQWEAAGRAHGAVFADHLPASSCIGGLDFLHPEILVEIEATAVLRSGR